MLFRCAALIVAQPGMSVGVVDIGGGTIDAKTMTLISLNPLRAKDACVGTGTSEATGTYLQALNKL